MRQSSGLQNGHNRLSSTAAPMGNQDVDRRLLSDTIFNASDVVLFGTAEGCRSAEIRWARGSAYVSAGSCGQEGKGTMRYADDDVMVMGLQRIHRSDTRPSR
jgi:hypothetical protein